MLTRHFVQKYAKRCKVKPKPVSREAMAALVNYEWPGNVRELENAIERALVMGSSDTVLLEDLPESLLEQESPAEMHEGKYHASVKELKKQLILDAVEQTRGNYVEAAGILGVHPNYLHRLIRNLGIERELQDALRARGRFGVVRRLRPSPSPTGSQTWLSHENRYAKIRTFTAAVVASGGRGRDRCLASGRRRGDAGRWRVRCLRSVRLSVHVLPRLLLSL